MPQYLNFILSIDELIFIIDFREKIDGCAIDSLIFFPSLAFKVELFGHANENDKDDRNERGDWAICTDSWDRLHDRIESIEAHNNLLVLDKERYRSKCRPGVPRCLDLIGRCLLLLSTRLEFFLTPELLINVRDDREFVLSPTT